MANYESNLARRNRELRQMGTGEDPKPKVKAPTDANDGPSSGPGTQTNRKGPNKYSVARKPGESLKDHAARVEAARKEAGY